MRTVSSLFTLAEYMQLPEGFPAQLIEGQLVKEPAPTYGHQSLAGRVYVALLPLVDPDHVVMSPTDVVLDEHNVFQPDVVVLGAIPPLDSSDVGIPRLAFEVLSPSTAERDRVVKRKRLLAAGVAEVWLVDASTETIEVWTPDGMRRARGEQAIGSDELEGFELVPEKLFEPPR